MEYFYTSADLPVATLEQPGITQLNSNVHDDRIDQAATPYGVKLAYELAEEAMAAAAANGLTASNNHALLLGARDTMSNDLYPLASIASNAYCSNEVTGLHGAVDALGNNVSLLQDSVAWNSNELSSLSNLSQATLGMAAFASNLAVWDSNAIGDCARDILSLSNALPSISAQATFGSNLSSNVALLQGAVGDLVPQVIAASNAAFFGSNAGAHGSNLAPTVASNSASIASLGADILSLGASVAWASNLSQAALGMAAFGSNLAVWDSNVGQAALGTAAFSSNALPSISSQAAFGSNTAVAASNQAFSVVSAGGNVSAAGFTATSFPLLTSKSGVRATWTTQNINVSWPITQTLPNQWVSLPAGSYQGSMYLQSSIGGGGTGASVPVMVASNCTLFSHNIPQYLDAQNTLPVNTYHFQCVVTSGQTGYLSGSFSNLTTSSKNVNCNAKLCLTKLM